MLKSFIGGTDKIHIGFSRNTGFFVKFKNVTFYATGPLENKVLELGDN